MPRLLPLAVLLALLPLLAGTGSADDDAHGQPGPPDALEMSQATVLASPGMPVGLEAFLPRGEKPQRLRWPLPPSGPLLVLGLPGSDPLAQRLADVFQLDLCAETLAGGYAVHAWQAEGRNLVLILAADAAALMAARFEFDASAPGEMMDPSMRSLDFTRPNQEAGLLVRTGTRVVRPRFATRAWNVQGIPPTDLVATLSGARANRVWIDDAQLCCPPGQRLQDKLAAHGIAAVHRIEWPGLPTGQGPLRAAADVQAYLSASAGDQARRYVALDFRACSFGLLLESLRTGGDCAVYEADVARLLAQHWRPALQELVVVSGLLGDPALAASRHAQTLPDLRGIPEAVLAWSGPLEHSTSITRADALRHRREAGVPVLLLDTWAAPFESDLYMPSLPTGRAADLGEVLAGIVVLGTRGTGALLESAWSSQAVERFGVGLLTPLVARDADDPQESLRLSAVRLAHAAAENMGLVPWMAPLAADLQAVKGPLQRVPLLPDQGAGEAGLILATPEGLVVRARSDGSTLTLLVQLPHAEATLEPLRLTLGARGQLWQLEVKGAQGNATRLEAHGDTPQGDAPDCFGHTTVLRRALGSGVELAWRLDRFALGGDAHELRHFALQVTRGARTIWPASGTTGTLLILAP